MPKNHFTDSSRGVALIQFEASRPCLTKGFCLHTSPGHLALFTPICTHPNFSRRLSAVCSYLCSKPPQSTPRLRLFPFSPNHNCGRNGALREKRMVLPKTHSHSPTTTNQKLTPHPHNYFSSCTRLHLSPVLGPATAGSPHQHPRIKSSTKYNLQTHEQLPTLTATAPPLPSPPPSPAVITTTTITITAATTTLVLQA